MTCIVGLVHKGCVYMGADSAGVGGMSLSHRADRKVLRVGEFLLGFTTSFRMGQLLGYKLRLPRRLVDQDIYSYMVTDFVDAVRQCLKDGGFASQKDEVEEGGTFLVGYEGRLFCIYDDYQVAERMEPYDACGCGTQLALGALFAAPPDMQPVVKINLALEAAAHFSAGVCGPFHIESLPISGLDLDAEACRPTNPPRHDRERW